jgi:hypothetical protein
MDERLSMACTVQRIRADDLHFLLANPIAHATMNIRPLDRADLAASAQVHADSFTRQREPLAWVTSTSSVGDQHVESVSEISIFHRRV